MNEYKPTHRVRCEDPSCKSYGKPCVDRGWGYPVCETNKWRHEVYPGDDKPMDQRYLERTEENEELEYLKNLFGM